MIHRAVRVLAMTWVGAVGAFAQSPPESGAPSALAGPRVAGPARASLVEHDFDGSVRRTEEPAEIAAARLLDLSESVKQKIEKIVEKRDRFFDSFVENNLELLGKLDTAGKANDRIDQALLGLEALSKLAPVAKDGSLRSQIRALLPSEAATRFDQLLKEYWDAIIVQERAKDPKKPRFAILAGERLQSITREATAAFQRLEKSGVLLYHFFFKDAAVSKEQETEIKTLLDEFVDESKGAPTKDQEATLFLNVMSKLDSKQQIELIRHVQGKPAKEPAVPKKTGAKDAPTPR